MAREATTTGYAMTEKEWLNSGEPGTLLASLGRKPGKRKHRLFGCACCRRIWPLIPDERCRAAVAAAEQFADGAIDAGELARARALAKSAAAEQVDPTYVGRWAAGACYAAAFANAGDAAKAWHSATSAQQMHALAGRGVSVGRTAAVAITAKAWKQELASQAVLLRDIFGNPFRPVAFSDSWRTDTVVSLARTMYESRDFSAMPILADALQDAGCDSDDILAHCHGPGPHVRGCWVVDLVLGKE